MGPPQTDDPDWWRKEDDERVAEQRARRLSRQTPWDDSKRDISLALAYRRLGYTYRGIADCIGSTSSTVSEYMEIVESTYCEAATLTADPDTLEEWPWAEFPFEESENDE